MKKLTVLFTLFSLLSSNSAIALSVEEEDKIVREVTQSCQTLEQCTKALVHEKVKNAQLQANNKPTTNTKKSTAKKSTKKRNSQREMCLSPFGVYVPCHR